MLPAPDRRSEAPAAAPVASRLLIRPGAIGDTVVWLPAAEAWRAPRTEIWAPSANLPLLAHLGHTRSIASTGLDLLGLPGVEPPPALVQRLRAFDEIVSWYGANRDEFRAAAAALDLNVRFFPALPDGARHACDYYLVQAGAPPGAAPRLPFERIDEGYAVIHPFSGGAAKNWPLDNYRELAARLKQDGVRVFWTAGPDELLDEAVRWPTLDTLAAWLARARVFIGNDSGPAHIAAACGVPVVVLFGPTDPRVWAPRGPRVAVVCHHEPVAAAHDAVRRLFA